MKARDNPFRTERLLQVRYRLRGVTWDELLARLAALNYRAALTGPRGAGKTTLLEELELRLRERGFVTHLVRLNEQQRVFPTAAWEQWRAGASGPDILLVDGAEQLRPLAWLRLRWHTRVSAGLVITTHRPGRLPTLRHCRTSPDLLADLAAELLGAEPEAVREQANALFEKHRGNLREALREWYDLAAAEIRKRDTPPKLCAHRVSAV